MDEETKYKRAWEWVCSDVIDQAINLRNRAAVLRSEAFALEEIATDLESIPIQQL